MAPLHNLESAAVSYPPQFAHTLFGRRNGITVPDAETGETPGVYILETNNLIVAQNLFADIASAGVHIRVEEERLIQGRGGTARNNRIFNNIVYGNISTVVAARRSSSATSVTMRTAMFTRKCRAGF